MTKISEHRVDKDSIFVTLKKQLMDSTSLNSSVNLVCVLGEPSEQQGFTYTIFSYTDVLITIQCNTRLV